MIGGRNPGVCVLGFAAHDTTAPFGAEVGDEKRRVRERDPGPITPSENDTPALTAVSFNAAGTFSINESYTLFGQVNRENTKGLAAAYKIQGAAAATTPRWTRDTTTSMTSNILWSQVSGGGGGGPKPAPRIVRGRCSSASGTRHRRASRGSSRTGDRSSERRALARA